MVIENLYGTWHLLSIYSDNEQGDRDYHFGKDAVGRLTYLPDGYMTALILQLNRPRFSGAEIDAGSPAEIRKAFEGFEAYGGKYTLDLDAGTVTHHVDIARSPSWENTDQLRHLTLLDGILKISAPPMNFGGDIWKVQVQWEKRSSVVHTMDNNK